MKIFVCEYITAGGRQGSELPTALAQEGELMFTALVNDLLDAGYRDLVCTRDERLASPAFPITVIPHGEDVWSTWQSLMRECDAAWIIAPESDEIMYRLARLAEKCSCRVIGCTSAFVRMATSKRQTAEWLQDRQIPVVRTYTDPQALSANDNGWIVKPDDGVGGEGVYYFPDLSKMREYWSRQTDKQYVVQPYIPGIAASMSLLCHAGRALVLGCNEQCFRFRADGKGELQAVIVNGLHRHHEPMSLIAGRLAAAMPEETAIIGVDLVINNRELTVIEINPRLTTSYAGLEKSLNANPAGLLLSLLQGGDMPGESEFKYHPVRINL